MRTAAPPGACWALPCGRAFQGPLKAPLGTLVPPKLAFTGFTRNFALRSSLFRLVRLLLFELHVDLASRLGCGGTEGPCPGSVSVSSPDSRGMSGTQVLLLALTVLHGTLASLSLPLCRKGRICQPSAPNSTEGTLVKAAILPPPAPQ